MLTLTTKIQAKGQKGHHHHDFSSLRGGGQDHVVH